MPPSALSSIERRYALQVSRRLRGGRMGAYDQPVVVCPYCRGLCDAEFVDVGVGMQQVTPYYCNDCGALQVGPHDEIDRELTPKEVETGWYEPPQPQKEETCHSPMITAP